MINTHLLTELVLDMVPGYGGYGGYGASRPVRKFKSKFLFTSLLATSIWQCKYFFSFFFSLISALALLQSFFLII